MEMAQAREAQARQQAADAAKAAIDEDSEEAVDAATYEVGASQPRPQCCVAAHGLPFAAVLTPPSHTSQARQMDEWKDHHRRGEGNRHNKG